MRPREESNKPRVESNKPRVMLLVTCGLEFKPASVLGRPTMF